MRGAFDALLPAGLTFLDTAEVYGLGESERITGEFLRASGSAQAFQVATKFAPLPWRLSSGSVEEALRASLARLGLPRCSLYMVHWPGLANDAYVRGLAEVQAKGLAQARTRIVMLILT